MSKAKIGQGTRPVRFFYHLSFQLNNGNAVLALAEKSVSEAFYRWVMLQVALYALSQKSSSLAVNNGYYACIYHYGVVDETGTFKGYCSKNPGR